MFIYLKLFLAVMFSWLLYATLAQIITSTYTLLRDRRLTFEDPELGEVVLEMGKDTKKITIFLLQHYLITTIFAVAVILMLT
jgi:hypothetical protein